MALNFANNNSLSAIDTKPSGLSGGALNLISTQTASSSSTISFTSGIDSTYDEYVFKFYDIHPATDNVSFGFNGSIDSGSNYNVTKTTTVFSAYHNEADSASNLGYRADEDLAHSSIRFGIGRFTTEDEVDYTAERCIKEVTRLREMSPLWEMYEDGIDIKSIQWTQH